ncbi:Protein of unknown function [Bacillus wiedmannii]
MVWIW